jgi:hypothetical protein
VRYRKKGDTAAVDFASKKFAVKAGSGRGSDDSPQTSEAIAEAIEDGPHWLLAGRTYGAKDMVSGDAG